MTRTEWVIRALGLAGAALVIGLWARGQPLWLDEQMVALSVRDRGFGDLVSPLWFEQSAPPGWVFLQYLATRLFGTGERALRLAPMLFGVATVGVAMWIARRWLGMLGSATLLCLVGASPWLIYHATEAKPYSADAFWGLMLPALAMWAIEATGEQWRRRVVVWWVAAAVGTWCANGATFAVPPTAVVLAAVGARRAGWIGVTRVAVPGLIWLASFAGFFAVSLAPTLGNDYMQQYWAFALPPPEAGLWDRLTWVGERLPIVAQKPGGSQFGIGFWAAAIGGLALARSRMFSATFAGVPVMAVVLAIASVVPFFERLVLWAMPALYVGIALLVDRAAGVLSASTRRRSTSGVLAVLGVCAGVVLAGDLVRASTTELRHALATIHNHQLDDRAAVRWLMSQQRQGDALVTTKLALPALWWYGGVVLTDARDSGSHGPAGVPILEVGHTRDIVACRRRDLARALVDHERLLLHLGFRFDDVPKDFDDHLLESLTRAGRIVAMRSFGGFSRAIVAERLPAGTPLDGRGSGRDFHGCLTLQPALRW